MKKRELAERITALENQVATCIRHERLSREELRADNMALKSKEIAARVSEKKLACQSEELLDLVLKIRDELSCSGSRSTVSAMIGDGLARYGAKWGYMK